MALFRMRSGDRSIAFAICSSAFLDVANSSKRRSSLKDQDFRTIAKKLPLQTNCKMSTQAVSRSPKALKGSLKRAPAALAAQALPRLLCRTRRSPFGILLTTAPYLRGNRGCPQGPAGFSNRVGSPPTQPGGLLWLRERLGWLAVVLAATESCEERDSPGIRPCGVTPAWPLSWGRGRL